MFQTAACIGYSKKYGVPWGVKKGYVERSFNADQIDRFFPHLPAAEESFKRHQEHKNGDFCELHQTSKDNCWFNYHPIPFYPHGIELAGFFQSEKYFEGAHDEIRKAFPLKEYPEYKDYVSIHVRRGDYVQHAHAFPPVTLEYIWLALVHLNFPKNVIVCSDDIQWCKGNFHTLKTHSGDNVLIPDFEYSEGRNEFEDLSVMASCKHNIISNSTLAWWGAWLNPNPDKIVVSPSCKVGNWFGHGGGVKTDVVDLLPPSWHQIQFR